MKNNKWNWKISKDKTLQIYYKESLCWEIDDFCYITNEKTDLFVKKFILQNQYMINKI